MDKNKMKLSNSVKDDAKKASSSSNQTTSPNPGESSSLPSLNITQKKSNARSGAKESRSRSVPANKDITRQSKPLELPKWVPDETVTECRRCHSPFNFLRFKVIFLFVLFVCLFVCLFVLLFPVVNAIFFY
jgi:hypothetical protein